MAKWLKSIFGNDDKEKKPTEPEIPPQCNPTDEHSIFEVIPVEEIDYMFQNMEQPPQVLETTEATQLKDTGQSNKDTNPKGNPSVLTQKPKGVVAANGGIQPKGGNRVFIPRIFEEDTKLTIILVENTEAVTKEKDKLEKIVKSLVTTGRVCVINYGKLVRKGKIVEAKDFECSKLLNEEVISQDACLYDALNALEEVVEENYKKTEELKNKRIRIKSIDIIGIGRCIDNCSIIPSEMAIESFCIVADHRDVTTKYFCLSEENFIDAATIGFHSIGAILRNYM